MNELKPCPICGAELKICGPEDWKPTFYDPDSGGDPYNASCDCGFSFSSGSYERNEFIAALNRRPAEPNEPLTMEELRGMDGEPVWIDGKDYGGWTIFKAGANKQVARCLDNVNLSYYMADYSKTWIAYRRKPESNAPSHASEGDSRPKCFYSDTASEYCLGMAHGDDDYPVRECEKCWYLDANEDLRAEQAKERELNG